MGHLGGELSMVEVAVAAYYKYMNYSVFDPATRTATALS